MTTYLYGVQYCLPDAVVTNEQLAAEHPDWNPEKILAKTGIRQRHVVSPGETAADLGFRAAETLLRELSFDRGQIDVLLFCTQSPDYFLPASACLLQDRLGLSTSCGALDFNQGCSGFTYGLWLSRALIESGTARNVLLIVGETYSRYCQSGDMTTATIFGDGAGAALIGHRPQRAIAVVGPSIVGSDGRGAAHLIVPQGAAREAALRSGELGTPAGSEPTESAPSGDLPNRRPQLAMNGPEVFSFTMRALRIEIDRMLQQLGIGWQDIDWYLFHQANRFMLESLQRALPIPPQKMPIEIADVGNTVSATIPILLRRMFDAGRFNANERCLLVGFGVGFSWCVTEIKLLASGPFA